jgi:hypothetical protein
MELLSSNPDKIEQMGRAGRKMVEEKLNSDIHYGRLMEIYEMARVKNQRRTS